MARTSKSTAVEKRQRAEIRRLRAEVRKLKASARPVERPYREMIGDIDPYLGEWLEWSGYAPLRWPEDRPLTANDALVLFATPLGQAALRAFPIAYRAILGVREFDDPLDVKDVAGKPIPETRLRLVHKLVDHASMFIMFSEGLEGLAEDRDLRRANEVLDWLNDDGDRVALAARQLATYARLEKNEAGKGVEDADELKRMFHGIDPKFAEVGVARFVTQIREASKTLDKRGGAGGAEYRALARLSLPVGALGAKAAVPHPTPEQLEAETDRLRKAGSRALKRRAEYDSD